MRCFLSIISNNLLVLFYKPIVSAQPRVRRPGRTAISVRLRGFVQLYARRIVYAVHVKKNVEEKMISLQERPRRLPGPQDVPRVEQQSTSIPGRSSRGSARAWTVIPFLGARSLFSPFLFHSNKEGVPQKWKICGTPSLFDLFIGCLRFLAVGRILFAGLHR